MRVVRESDLRGSTLLEVAVALGIMATCALGLMSTHLGTARHAQVAQVRERAAFAASAFAEALRAAGGAGPTTAATDKGKALTAAILPDGQSSTSSAGGDASIATVSWAAARFVAAPGSAVPSRAASCIEATVPEGRDCVALAFLR